MRQVPPDTRFLLLGLAESCLATVSRGLRAAGASVDVAHHGPRAHQLVRARGYDVILVTLPGKPSVSLAELTFYRHHGAGARILAVVPARNDGEMIRALDGGADDCVTASFEVEELLARLCALGRRGSDRWPKGAILRTHDLEIDTGSRMVRRGGRILDLTVREYALLQLLAMHCGRVLSRNRIREHLYGGAEEMTSNVIDVYIRYLRTKVDRGFEPPLILTRWGQGYLLRDEDPVQEMSHDASEIYASVDQR